MSQAIADIGAAVVAVGSLVAAPFTGGASLAGLGLAGALLQVGAAEGQKQQTQANVGNFNYGTGGSILGAGAAGAGVPGAGPAGPASSPSPGGTDTSAPPVVTQTNEAGIAAERYSEAETQIGSMQAQLGQTVLGEKVAETTSEGAITAGAAARGLKLSGSPLMQLISQKQAGAQAIQYTQNQGVAAIQGAQTGAQASYNAAALSGQEELQYANQEVSNAWLSAFGSAIQAGGALTAQFFKASPTQSADVGGYGGPDPFGGDTGYGEGGGEEYFGY